MTTYTAIPNASLAVGGIPSSTTVTLLRDNPIAVAESSTGAPVVAAGWHPVSKVTVGDGEAGLIYDFATNGVQASIITADFADGWEYRIIASDMQHNSGGVARLQINAYFQTDAVYRRVLYTPESSSITYTGCDIEFLMPRVSKRGHFFRASGYMNTTAFGEAYIENVYDATVQKILRAQVNFSAGSIAGGQIWLMRRREYASSP